MRHNRLPVVHPSRDMCHISVAVSAEPVRQLLPGLPTPTCAQSLRATEVLAQPVLLLDRFPPTARVRCLQPTEALLHLVLSHGQKGSTTVPPDI